MKKNNIPLRRCLGCGNRFPKGDLVRIGRTPKEKKPTNILICNGYIEGRGAYLCKDCECLKKARKARRLERAFSCRIDQEIYDSLERMVCKSER